MKTWIVLGLLVIIVFLFIGNSFDSKHSFPLLSGVLTEDSGHSTSTRSVSSQSLPSETFLVTRIIDGDTIELEGGTRVRYIGINTPESVDPRKPVQCFGLEASKKNGELVLGKRVHLEKDVSENDKYGRLLRFVYVGDTLINLTLIEEGYASAFPYPPDISRAELFRNAERGARESQRGLWGSCNKTSTEDTNLSDGATAPTGVAPESGCLIKGNISASGKIFHTPSCPHYTKTVINESADERWFCSEEEALNAGWRKALNCP